MNIGNLSILLFLLASLNAWSLPETSPALINGLIYEQGSLFTIESFNASSDGARINYTRFERGSGDKGAIVISPGRVEASVKYIEVAYDLSEQGHSPIYIIDHRGQGFSERFLDNPQKGYVEKFRQYTSDFKEFVETIVMPQTKGQKISLISHSMGSAIASDYLQENNHSFSKVIHVAPMYQIILPNSERVVLARTVFQCYVLFDCNAYVPNGSDYYEKDFSKNEVTKSKIRFEFNRLLNREFPEIQLGSATYRWLRENIKAIRKIRKKASDDTPTLILQAAADKIVVNKAQDKYCEKASNCTLKRLENSSEHNILNERDIVRDEAMELILNHLD